MTISAARAQQINFTVPYYTEGAEALLHKSGKFQNGEELVECVLLAFGSACAIDLVEGVLLEIDAVDELALQVEDEVGGGGTFLADDLHHLVDLVALAQDGLRLRDLGG